MKEVSYYKDIGYENHGYVSPELSSSEVYPKYIDDEVRRCVKNIWEQQTPGTITFAFMTDIHYALSYNHKIRMQRTMNAYKEIAKRVHIDKLILGGDYTNEGKKEYKAECFRELRAELDHVDYFPINGNHDDGSIWDHKYIESVPAKNHLKPDELYTLFYNHLPSLGANFDEDNKGLYYYCDDKDSKTRYIFIDACNIPYLRNKDGSLKYRGQDIFTLSQKQYDWLINKALKFNEEGWSVLFFTHSAALPSERQEELKELRVRMRIFSELIEAYQRGVNYAAVYSDEELSVNINADFSQYIRGDVICVYVGDYHIDHVEHDNAGIPYILTANSVMYTGGSPLAVKRHDGDKSELLFDIAVVNKKERTISITRVGAGKDRVVNY